MRSLSSTLVLLATLAALGCATGTNIDSSGGAAGKAGSSAAGSAGSAGSGAAGSGGTAGASGESGSSGGGQGGSEAGSGGSEAGSGGAGGTGGSAQGGGGTGGQPTGTGGTGGMAPVCGDMVVSGNEQCDGMDLNGLTCEALGHVGGTLSCDPVLCVLDTTNCHNCNNGLVEPMLGEDCDFDSQGKPLVLTTCAGLRFPESSANPGCDPTCQYDTTPCLCGNSAVDASEDCDGADFNGKTCMSFGFAGGDLTCNASCEIVATACNQCGNDMIDGAEQCDGPDLGGETCASAGFTAGMLSCGPSCQLVTTGCTKCGNGTLEIGELCDDGNTAAGDGCSPTCQIELMSCDPDGTYAIVQGGPISYSCCFGLVSVNVSSFLFSSDGATIQSSPSNPVSMTGAATTCPAGNFNDTGSIAGGCTETYNLTGSFTGQNTWSGVYSISFSGPDCSCFGGAGTPCINQSYPITAMR
jgi:cysteine-rich repeat protein